MSLMAMDYEMELEESRTEGIAEGIAKGIAKGEQQRSRDIARRLLLRGLPLDLIAEDTGLTVEQVRALQR